MSSVSDIKLIRTDFFFVLIKFIYTAAKGPLIKNQNITLHFSLNKLITKVSKGSFPRAIYKKIKINVRGKIKVRHEVFIIIVLNKRQTIYNIYTRI